MYAEYQQCKAMKGGASSFLTGADIEGPFYKEGAPFVNALTDQPTLFLTGRVVDANGNPVAGAVLDFWQADEHREPYVVVAGDKGSPTHTGKLSYVVREADALGWELDRVTFRATPTKGSR